MLSENATLLCDGWCRPNPNPVTHIGSRGYIYCAECAKRRRNSGFERCRKMAKWEMEMLQKRQPLSSYERIPKPNAAAPSQTSELPSPQEQAA